VCTKPGTGGSGSVLSTNAGTNYLIGFLLLIVTCAAYFPVVTYPFVDLDDPDYVVDNPHTSTGLSWPNVAWALSATEKSNWFPLTWVSHQLDCQIFGLYAGGHHLTNLLLHILNAGLLFWLLERATGARWRSAMVAALFALHPLNVESVAWVAERKNLLCTLFFLLTLAAYGWYVQNPQVQRYLWVAALFVLGLASKPMVITLPFVLLLIDYWPLGRIEGWSSPSAALPVPQQRFSRLLLEKVPLLALSAASAVITIIAQNSGGSIRSLSDFSFATRLENAICSYALYIAKAFWPTRLTVYYPFPEHGVELWRVALALLFLVAVSVAILIKRSSYLVFGWLLFLGTLVPVAGIVQVGGQAMADRYAYVPIIGLLVLGVWGAADWMESRHSDAKVGGVACGILVLILSVLTRVQVGHWRSSTDLWAQAASATNDNFVAEKNLANALLQLNQVEEALPHLQRAARINPQDVTCHVNLGGVFQKQGNWQAAVSEYATAVQIASGQNSADNTEPLGLAYASLGSIYGQLGDYSKALASYWQAEQTDPNVMDPFIPGISRLISAPLTAEGYLRVGQLLQQGHRTKEAEVAYEEALKLDANSPARTALQQMRDH
jgi:protein O-mannosyl-transferase